MNLFEFVFSSEFTRAFAWTLFHSIWQGGLIALMAAGLLIILHKHRPVIRYIVLYSLLFLIPVIFTATFLYTYHPENAKDFSESAIAIPKSLPENSILSGIPALTGKETAGAWYIHPMHIFENKAGWLVLFWFLGFFIFLLRFSGSMLYVYRLKNNNIYPVDKSWNDNLQRLSGRMGLLKPVILAESALTRIPLTIGYLKPVILLPLGTLSGVPPQQIEAILLHELAHILRKDYLFNIIQSVIELLFFYHPVTWWLSKLIRQEREHICDDLVISINHDHINYIKALTTMEDLNSKSALLASALAGSRKNLLFRIKRLITPVNSRKGFGEGIIAFILIIGLVFTLSFNALSIIPSAYDLSGRESGEKLYNLIPFNPKDLPETISERDVNRPTPGMALTSEIPDTAVAKSKSGKVIITIFTDSTNQVQQEELDRMAESVDKQAQQYDKAMKEYQIQVQKFKDDKDRIENECKVMVIKKADSTSMTGDSIIVIYNDSGSPFPGHHFEYRMPQPGCPVPPHAREFRYLYSRPDIPDMENFEREEFYQQYPGNVPPEKIIRQELIDDGLAVPSKSYIIDLDSSGMYINGEKQSKEIFRKYKRLVESLDVGDLEGDGTYRLIF